MKTFTVDLPEGAKADMYIVDNFDCVVPDRKHPFVVVCPGGGYSMLSAREGEPISRKLLSEDISSCVLWYSVAPEGKTFPSALRQLFSVIAYVREHADELNVDPDKIFVEGFSAGGHLAASACVFWNKPIAAEISSKTASEIRPNGGILCYPVITSGEYAHRGSFENLLGGRFEAEKDSQSLENLVDSETPPVFLWHTANDDCVPVQNSLLFAEAMAAHSRRFELHIYPDGPHGMSMCNNITVPMNNTSFCNDYYSGWVDDSIHFILNTPQ